MNRHTFCVLSLFIISSMFASCSSLNFVAGGKTPFKISAGKNSDQTVVAEGSADFYFWGKSPGSMKIDLEDLENKLGLNYPSYVSVEQTTSWKSFFFTAVTLGLYCPVDYKIKVLTAKEPLE